VLLCGFLCSLGMSCGRWECVALFGHTAIVAGADLEAKRLLLPGPHTIRRVGAPPTERCARPAFVEARPRGEALAPARPALHSPRGRASYGRVHICLCGRPDSGRSSCSCQAALHSPRGRASYGRGCTSACVGGPPSGRSSYSPRPAHHSPRGRASYTAVCTACFCGRPALGAKLLLLKTSRSAQAGTHVGWALAHHTRRYA